MSGVAIAICTHDRPEGLRRLLNAIADLKGKADIVVVVVDNHPGRAGLDVCAELKQSYRWQIVTAFEPERGISQARNTACALALEQDVELIACLDDDEWPEAEWLSELLRVREQTGADVVGGPVWPSFVRTPPDWVVGGGYFNPPNHADGSAALLEASGNFLIRAACLRALGPEPFDPTFSRTGGEDTHFFARLAKRGCKMAWAHFACAYEEIPPHRVSTAWIGERWRRYGSTAVHIDRMLNRSMTARARRTVFSAAFLVRALSHITVARLGFGDRHLARMRLAYAHGRLLGHAGSLLSYYVNDVSND